MSSTSPIHALHRSLSKVVDKKQNLNKLQFLIPSPRRFGGQAGHFNAMQEARRASSDDVTPRNPFSNSVYKLHAESRKQCQDPCLTIGCWLLVLIQDKDDPSRKDMFKNHAARKL